MPVHWSGRPCEMKKIFKIAKKYNLKNYTRLISRHTIKIL